MVFRFLTGRLAQSLGRATGGRGQQDTRAHAPAELQDGAHGGRLARAGAAGEHGEPMGEGGAHGLALLGRPARSRGLAQAGERWSTSRRRGPANSWSALGPPQQPLQPVADADLAVEHRRQVDDGIFAQQILHLVDRGRAVELPLLGQ